MTSLLYQVLMERMRRRAELGLAMLDRYADAFVTSEPGATGLAVPVPR